MPQLEQSQAWGRQVVLGPVHYHTSHPVAQPHSHPYTHMVPDTVAQPKVDIATRTAIQLPHRHIHYSWPHIHICVVMCSHNCTPIHSATYYHTFTAMSTLGYVYTCYLFTMSDSAMASLSAIPQSHAHSNTPTQWYMQTATKSHVNIANVSHR